jgi:transposase-like protein/uncharacterized protein YfbU (UPF0304 family)
MEKFPTERAIINYFILIRYGNQIYCNHCGSVQRVYQKHNRLKVFNCNDCNNTFSPFKNTIFEKSSTDLRKWFYAVHLFVNGKKGISGLQLQREVNVTYKCAWRILKQIRIAMGNKANEEFVRSIVEMDETYVGGEPRKNNIKNDKIKSKRGRGTNQTPIIGVADRVNKKIHAKIATVNEAGKKLSGRQLLDVLEEVSKEECNVVITDEFNGYNLFDHTDNVHLRINHRKEYADGFVHTNNIESFWATLKRGIYGIYHHVSVRHLQKYIDEFCFRWNNRQKDMFDLILVQAVLGY